VVPLLLEHAAKEAAVPRAALNAALGRLGDGRAIPHLLDDINYPDEKSRGLIPRLPALSRIPLPYSREQTAVASAALRALGEIGDPVAVGALLEVAYDSARDSSYFDNLAWSLGVLGDHQAANVLETIGVRGALIHGQYIVAMADSSRVEALRSIGRLRLEEMVPKIRSIDPLRCSLSVREAAAEVLSVLTGERYAARLPVQLEHFFLEANDDPADINAPRQPIVFLVGQGPGD
jgi:HEAT repeat protein